MAEIPLSQALVGSWTLVSREDRTLTGERRIDPALGEDPQALLFYDRGGNFAAQFMKRGPRPEQAEAPRHGAPNNSRAVGGYDAYFGTYTVDDAAGRSPSGWWARSRRRTWGWSSRGPCAWWETSW